jgi:hypothetical protein
MQTVPGTLFVVTHSFFERHLRPIFCRHGMEISNTGNHSQGTMSAEEEGRPKSQILDAADRQQSKAQALIIHGSKPRTKESADPNKQRQIRDDEGK